MWSFQRTLQLVVREERQHPARGAAEAEVSGAREEIHPRLPAWLGAEAAEVEVLPPRHRGETGRFPVRAVGAVKWRRVRQAVRAGVAEEEERRPEEPREV